MKAKNYTLKELSLITKTPSRTIRFYISKNLLEPPVKRGRNSFYTDEHVKRLKQIKELKEKGMLLKEIALQYEAEPEVLNPTYSVNFQVSEDVVVTVKADIPPWRMKKIKELIKEMHEKLNTDK